MTATTIRKHSRQTAKRAPVRADLARNAALLAVLWVAYAVVRGITAGDLAAATENARAIIDLQQALGLPSEGALQGALLIRAPRSAPTQPVDAVIYWYVQPNNHC